MKSNLAVFSRAWVLICLLAAGALPLGLRAEPTAAGARLRAVQPGSVAASESVVFVDAGIADYQTIVRGVLPGQRVVVLDPQRDELGQITAELSATATAGKTLKQVHLVSHGSPGALRLGQAKITIEVLQSRAEELRGWRRSLEPGAEILLYGCEAGAGGSGDRFLKQWADLTGASVAGSTNLTGAAKLGGDWNLEASVGSIRSLPAFDFAALDGFASVLADYIFYHDGTAGRLYRADLDGSNTNQILAYNGSFQSTAVDFVVVDPIRTNIYYNRTFNDSNRGLYKTTYAGASPLRVSPNTTNLVSGVSIDLINQKIYLHDDTAGRWYRMDLDGGNATVLQTIAATGAHSAVDYKNSAFYYTQTIAGSTRGLYKTDLAMTTQGTLITTAGNQVTGVAVDMVNSRIYYHDFTGQGIFRANLNGSGASSMLSLSSTNSAVALTVDHINQKVYYSAAAGSIGSFVRGIYRTADMDFTSPTKISLHGTDQIGPVGITTYYAPAPSITGISGPSAGNYNAGDHLDFTVTYDTAVDVTGSPYLPLTVGSSSVNATYASGTGTTTLVFRYTVQAGDTDSNGIASASPLVLNGGTIYKASTSTAANLTFNTPNTSSVLVDTTAPTVSIGTPSASLTAGGPVSYTVTYSDANFQSATLSAGNITVNSTGSASPSSVVVSGSGTTRTVTLSGITGNGTLSISVASGTATDTAGNSAAGAGPSTSFTVDNTAPTVSIGAPSASFTAGGPVSYTVTYSDAHFQSATLSAGNITVNSTGSAAPSSVVVSGSGTTRTVTLAGITGDGTLGISIPSGTATDKAGNTADGAGPSAAFTVDNTGPGVSIGSPSTSTTTTGPVSYTVTYSDANFSSATLSSGDVTVNSTGTAAAGSVVVSGTGSTRTVTLSSLSGVGTLGISVAAGTASDTAGNLAAAAGPSTTFTVQSPPVVTTVVATNLTVTTAVLNATVNPFGLATTAAFESGLDTNYGTVSAITLSPDDGVGAQDVSVTLTGLTPNTTYHFRAVGTNSAGIADGGDLTFTTAANTSAPTDITLTSASVAENQPSGTVVGTLGAVDPDAGDTAAFSLVTGTGDTDNASFAIVGSALQTGAVFDYETKNSYSIRVQVTDAGGLTFEKAFTITVSNVNEPPTYSGYGFNCPVNTSVSLLVSKILAKTSDPEGTARTLASVDGTTLQGGTVALLNGPPKTISYTPPTGYTGSDSFEVRISDGVNTITGIVTVTVGSSSGNGTALVSATMVGSDMVLKFAGIPGAHYEVQRSGGLTPPVTWTTLTTVTADASGFATYTDSNPPSPSYWRTVTVP
jgi:hypothetical protein